MNLSRLSERACPFCSLVGLDDQIDENITCRGALSCLFQVPCSCECSVSVYANDPARGMNRVSDLIFHIIRHSRSSTRHSATLRTGTSGIPRKSMSIILLITSTFYIYEQPYLTQIQVNNSSSRREHYLASPIQHPASSITQSA